ncbi:MAG TPA: HRDC domain-containing protein, partial [Kofleriaceae bacterium]|nr:HRDC domain-containing protein [Kofleriaceae bacterium]
MAALVADPDDIAAIAVAIASSPLVAFDLEFLSQERLVPTLCLLQIAHVPFDARGERIVADQPTVRLLDTLAVDVGPVVRALAAHGCAVAHAPRQDLQLLATRFGVAMPAIVDTQTMAAFAGLGDQIGFSTLANELVTGLALGKEQQWTAWAKRPLSEAQLTYADADVRYLPSIYLALAAKLGPRLEWARAESAKIAADASAAAAITPETAWQHMNLRGLDPSAAAAVVEMAAWRQRVAIELDRPLGHVLTDKLILDLARHRPRDAGAVRSAKGISELARKRADDLFAAVAAAKPENAPAAVNARGPSQRAQRWADVLVAITQLVADQTGVASRLLATRSDADEAARAIDERGFDATADLPAFSTWRREVL